MFRVPEEYRVKHAGNYSSDASFGNNGLFFLHSLKLKKPLRVVASDGEGWEHVSVSLPDRCPTWEEMCFVKALFWDEEDCVVQYHPPKVEYINMHPYCLHLWREIGVLITIPPQQLIGLRPA